ncbi:substrate-binding domain-containing protein [Mycetocola spongiae]|uniref:substrate-binding domain-containing protein n=1 Tax=Mycetocola spongiae TaxID=2859226 RepID=UPI001CF57CEF|nr:substrate-binding domain-containing protein [Mycetocola spongiae]UCR88060.1 substrate-binding domain-containing protein [Mycetocola spongiae]
MMTHIPRARRSLLAAATLATLALTLSACSTSDPAAGGAGGDAPIVALLLPENQTSRYEARDKPTFEAELKKSCPECVLKYYNAAGDANKQLSQAESALTEGAAVLVIDPVDSNAAASMVGSAKRQKVAVMSYDRVIYNADVDYAVKFDNEQQGAVGMKSLLDKLAAEGKTSGNIVMMNGDPVDSGAAPEKRGAHSVIDGSGYTIAAEYDTKKWSAENAQNQMQQAITAIGAENIDGVYAGNDGMATGVIAALKSAGVSPMPPVTGLDTQLDAIQKMVAGDLYESTYLPVEQEATIAARAAAELARGKVPAGDLVNGDVDDQSQKVPAYLLESIAVTMENMREILIDSGYLTIEQICTPEYAAACSSAGLR